MKLYIAGKITGDDDYQVKFIKARLKLERQGHIVLSPAALPEGLSTADYMRICFAMIDCVDAVVFLPDWVTSKGAQLERQHCSYIGKRILNWGELGANHTCVSCGTIIPEGQLMCRACEGVV